MNDRTLTLPADTATRLDNLARRLGVPLDVALAQIAVRMDVMDRIAAMLAVGITPSPAPLRLRPAELVSEEIAIIEVAGNVISTRLPHPNDRFVAVVKGQHYQWDGQWWTRTITKFAEPIADRAVELGVRLLTAGFPVEVRSEDLWQRIAAGDYATETLDWIAARTAGKYAGWFCIQWDRNGNRDYFRPASLIHGSHCYPGTALVPAARYDEILDFAEMHGFAISDGALNLVARAKRERDAMLLVTPVVRAAPMPQTPITPITAETAEIGILDELADEPL